MGGYHYRLNLYTPYWDPECGVWVDAMAAGRRRGVHRLARHGAGPGRTRRRPPVARLSGPLSDVRFAARVVAMGAWPDHGQFFALGGGTLFRGFDLAERQGSASGSETPNCAGRWFGTWSGTCSITASVPATSGSAAFYDVGGIYANGRIVGDVAHALGAGLARGRGGVQLHRAGDAPFRRGQDDQRGDAVAILVRLQHAF